MAVPNTIKVPAAHEYVFPRGAMFLGVEPVTDFDLKGKTVDDQARDKESGLRLWVVTVVDMDRDESARFRRTAEVKVKIASEVRPVPPPSQVPGYNPLVAFEGLTLTPYVDQRGCRGTGRCGARLAFSIRATAMVEPGALAPAGLAA